MDIKQELINSIMSKLKINDSFFERGQVEDAVNGIDVADYKEFFRQLSGDDYDYKNPLDRVEIVSKSFKQKSTLPQLVARKSEAAALLDSLLAKSNAMLHFASLNRNAFPSDWDFFGSCKLEEIRDKHNAKIFNRQELYIINELGREWLMNMSNRSVPELTRHIELVIMKAQELKALGANERKLLEVVR